MKAELLKRTTDAELKKYDSREEVLVARGIREALIRVGREARRMDKTTYLIPDYKKYRQALKDEGIE